MLLRYKSRFLKLLLVVSVEKGKKKKKQKLTKTIIMETI